MLVTIPVAMMVVDFAIPSQFDETYYGALPDLYQKLAETEGPKVVIIGTSSVPFGVDSALLTRELNACGLKYTVCNFGLYGTLGMKLMMDLSLEHIQEGDIVILSPELNAEVMSLSVHGQEVWRAIEDNKDLFWKIPDKGNLMGNYFGYIAEKLSCHFAGKPAGSGIYARDSFNENGDLRYSDREHNVMVGGYDSNNPITFDPALLNGGFVDYLHDYCVRLTNKGATTWYAFAPMNRAAVISTDSEIERFCDQLLNAIDFDTLNKAIQHLSDVVEPLAKFFNVFNR